MRKYLFIGLMVCSIYGYADTNTANHQTSNTNDNNLLVQLVDTKLANMEDKLARVEKANQDSIAEVKSSVDDKLSDKFKQLDDRAGDIDHWFTEIDWILTILFFVIPFVGYWINSKVNENIKTSKEELDKFTKDASDKINKQLEDTNTRIKDKLEYADRLLAQIKENHSRSRHLTEEQEKMRINPPSEVNDTNKDDVAAISQAAREKPENQLTAEDWFIRGLDAANKQEYYEAITYFTNVLRLEADAGEGNSNTYYNRGTAKASLGKHEEAIQDYDEAIRLNPEQDSAYYNRGTAKLKLYKYEEAIEDYDKAIEMNPQSIHAHFNKACAYALLKNKPAALQSLDDALKLGLKIEDILTDSDWREYLDDAEFKALINKYKKDNHAKQD